MRLYGSTYIWSNQAKFLGMPKYIFCGKQKFFFFWQWLLWFQLRSSKILKIIYPCSSFCSKVIVNMAWERLDLLFMAVAPVALDADPCSKHLTISAPHVTTTSCKPAIYEKKKIFRSQESFYTLGFKIYVYNKIKTQLSSPRKLVLTVLKSIFIQLAQTSQKILTDWVTRPWETCIQLSKWSSFV